MTATLGLGFEDDDYFRVKELYTIGNNLKTSKK
jgi:hypothetical protein